MNTKLDLGIVLPISKHLTLTLNSVSLATTYLDWPTFSLTTHPKTNSLEMQMPMAKGIKVTIGHTVKFKGYTVSQAEHDMVFEEFGLALQVSHRIVKGRDAIDLKQVLVHIGQYDIA